MCDTFEVYDSVINSSEKHWTMVWLCIVKQKHSRESLLLLAIATVWFWFGQTHTDLYLLRCRFWFGRQCHCLHHVPPHSPSVSCDCIMSSESLSLAQCSTTSRRSLKLLKTMSNNNVLLIVLCAFPSPGEVDPGNGGSREQRRGWRCVRGPQDEGVSSGQSAGAPAVGRGHGRAADVDRTHPARRHVPLTKTGLGVAAGRGQFWETSHF